jgi:anti-sigma B factor antagonist
MEPACFSLASERDGTTVCLTLAGELDRGAIGQVEGALETARELPLKHVVLDLSALTFLDVAGLRTILKVHRRAQAEAFDVTVIRPRGLANRVFTLTRAGEILSMADG